MGHQRCLPVSEYKILETVTDFLTRYICITIYTSHDNC